MHAEQHPQEFEGREAEQRMEGRDLLAQQQVDLPRRGEACGNGVRVVLESALSGRAASESGDDGASGELSRHHRRVDAVPPERIDETRRVADEDNPVAVQGLRSFRQRQRPRRDLARELGAAKLLAQRSAVKQRVEPRSEGSACFS